MTTTTESALAAERHVGRGWVVFTAVALWAIFLQSVTAGRILTGDDWARDAHLATANGLIMALLAAGIAAFVVLRERPGGRRLGLMFVLMAVALFVQHGLGTQAAEGEDTLWLHIPLGVAIVGFAAHVNVLARQLASGASK